MNNVINGQFFNDQMDSVRDLIGFGGDSPQKMPFKGGIMSQPDMFSYQNQNYNPYA